MDRKKLSPPTRADMEKLEKEKISLKEENHTLKEKLAEVLEENRTLREQRSTFRQQLAGCLEEKEKELEAQRQKTEATEKDRDVAHASLAEDRRLLLTKLENSKKDLERCEKEMEARSKTTNDLKYEHQETKQELKTYMQTNATMLQQQTAAQQQLQQLREELYDVQKKRTDAQDEIARLQEVISAAQETQRTQDEAQRREDVRERNTMLQQLQDTQDEITQIQKTSNILQEKIYAAQENQRTQDEAQRRELLQQLQKTIYALPEALPSAQEIVDALQKMQHAQDVAHQSQGTVGAHQCAQDDAQRRHERQSHQKKLQDAEQTNDGLRRQLQASQDENVRLQRLIDARNDQIYPQDATATMCKSLKGIQRQLILRNHFPHVRPFDGDNHERFVDWRTDMEITLTQLEDEDGGAARSLAIRTLQGPAAAYAAHLMTQQPEITWNELKEKMEIRYFDMVNRTLVKRQLKDFKQGEHEDVRDYYLRLVRLATQIHGQELYNPTLQTELVEIFVDGLFEGALMEKLVRLRPSNLEEALQAAAREQSFLKTFEIRRKSPAEPNDVPKLMELHPTTTLPLLRREISPEKDATTKPKSPQCHLTFGKERVTALIDTGAEVSVVRDALLKRIPRQMVKKITPPHFPRMDGPEGSPLYPTKTAHIECDLGGITVSHPFLVVHNLRKNLIIGSDFLIARKAKVDLEDMTLRIQGNEAVDLFLHAEDEIVDPLVPVITTPMYIPGPWRLAPRRQRKRSAPTMLGEGARRWTPTADQRTTMCVPRRKMEDVGSQRTPSLTSRSRCGRRKPSAPFQDAPRGVRAPLDHQRRPQHEEKEEQWHTRRHQRRRHPQERPVTAPVPLHNRYSVLAPPETLYVPPHGRRRRQKPYRGPRNRAVDPGTVWRRQTRPGKCQSAQEQQQRRWSPPARHGPLQRMVEDKKNVRVTPQAKKDAPARHQRTPSTRRRRQNRGGRDSDVSCTPGPWVQLLHTQERPQVQLEPQWAERHRLLELMSAGTPPNQAPEDLQLYGAHLPDKEDPHSGPEDPTQIPPPPQRHRTGVGPMRKPGPTQENDHQQIVTGFILLITISLVNAVIQIKRSNYQQAR